MIFGVVALACEARPLIKHYHLTRHHIQGPFPLYQGTQMLLVVSGPGKIAAAAAVAYVQGLATTDILALPSNRSIPWFNMGIAGHQSLALGTPFMAHKIIDSGSNQSYYPAFPFHILCPTCPLITVEQVETNYDTPSGYDMEAAGFWPIASRFSTSEIVHCIKIVSDNPSHPTSQINKQRIEEWCTAALDLLDNLIAVLAGLAQQHSIQTQAPAFLHECQKKWHFSVSQKHQLKYLLTRWQSLGLTSPPWDTIPSKKMTGGQFLQFMEAHLEQCRFHL